MGASQSSFDKSVVIVGGGYGGVNLAKELDGKFNVILIDKKDVSGIVNRSKMPKRHLIAVTTSYHTHTQHFLHCVGGLRGCVSPGWSDLIMVPYDKLLKKGQIKQGEVTSIDAKVCMSTCTYLPSYA